MNLFSISQLEQFSGIKPHTIRIWETRYNALTPTRSEGNTRYYNNKEFRRLLNIVSLMNDEYKVSELCVMPDEKLHTLIGEKLKNKITGNDNINYFITQMLLAGMTYDELYFDKLFSSCLQRFGLKDTYVMIIYPMLDRIGMMWTIDTILPAQEHFISNLIKKKLIAATDQLSQAKSDEDSWILYLPENEFHEIGLLFAQFLIRASGKKIIYLGCNLPLDTLITAIQDIKPKKLLFFLVNYNNPIETQKYLNYLHTNLKKIKIYISGSQKLISKLKTGKNLIWIKSVSELQKLINPKSQD